eukprot:TRINITY_DN4609_c0_g1_i1.p1 TRINITY_DN4609_c0_g1~~TRINITY_DN4609_c0_g1_i1.p1  ORF type:complete len:426 (+),score=100.60 TRINITY_DN4609_c0_g1_i1:83-1360(+)
MRAGPGPPRRSAPRGWGAAAAVAACPAAVAALLLLSPAGLFDTPAPDSAPLPPAPPQAPPRAGAEAQPPPPRAKPGKRREHLLKEPCVGRCLRRKRAARCSGYDCWDGPPPAGEHNTSGAALSLFTYMSHAQHRLECVLLATAAAAGVAASVTGWNGTPPSVETGDWTGAKLQAVAAFLAGADPRALVMYVDAYDVVLTASSPAQLAAAYSRWRQSTGLLLMFAAEATLYDRWARIGGRRRWRAVFFGGKDTAEVPYLYPNTGVWLAPAGVARWFFAGLARYAEEQPWRKNTVAASLDDQSAVTRALADLAPIRAVAGLDHNATLAQSLWAAQGDLCREGGELRNNRSGSAPLAWHANGGLWQQAGLVADILAASPAAARPLPDARRAAAAAAAAAVGPGLPACADEFAAARRGRGTLPECPPRR